MAFLLAAASLPASALFALRAIEVEGTVTLDPQTVIAASGLTRGAQSVFRVDVQEVARRLGRHPRIAAARVRPQPPHTIHLLVRERVPAAAVPYGDAYALVDADGVVVEIAASRPPLPLVSERGRPLAWAAPGQRIPAPAVGSALAALPLIPDALREQVAHLQVTPDREVILYTTGGLEMRAGPLRGLRERLLLALEILRAAQAEGVSLEYLDLRVPGSVVIKPRTSP